ncbi:DNA-J related domain-containing protein [Arhodomonas sp. SL1]|uniref:DNA-J related domain-containing protein n=1 Tax=Arhodomonas sp. SL1 TaxID=3425691 RepID=UPI003F8831E8
MRTPAWPGPWDHHLPLLEELLREAAPAALSEFELIRVLQARSDVPEIDGASLSTPLGLYRTHFLLFHTLYRLAERLAAGGEALEIHCLRIRLLPASPQGTSRPAMPDPLREFYAEHVNLEEVDELQVQRLLGSFWGRFAAGEERGHALAVLGLEDPVDDAEIKRAYRRLAMRHHPDRGGDGERLREIHHAVRVLGLS